MEVKPMPRNKNSNFLKIGFGKSGKMEGRFFLSDYLSANKGNYDETSSEKLPNHRNATYLKVIELKITERLTKNLLTIWKLKEEQIMWFVPPAKILDRGFCPSWANKDLATFFPYILSNYVKMFGLLTFIS